MANNFVEVKVEEGVLRGREEQSDGLKSVTFYSFEGIPFAKPPIGELRFKEPQPLEPWNGVKDALEGGPACPQNMMGSVYGDEDCLYLNVFTPEHPDEISALKPVFFSVHGGGFCGGDGRREVWTPDYFIDHDVVFVACNYRVGALGFLSLQNDEVSGNAGLKDVIQALRWTQWNIKQFGGDPDHVTVMGMSAGGAAVEFLLLSEMSRGLFKHAICQSGSSLNPWACNRNPKQLAVQLAETLGYVGNTADDKALVDFLRDRPAFDIVDKQLDLISLQERMLVCAFTFAPCIEKKGKGEKFITCSPQDILQGGHFIKVPVIIGCTTNEGSVMFTPILDLELINKNAEFIIPPHVNVPKNKREDVAREIMQFYFGDKPVTMENIDPLVDLIADVAFNTGIHQATYLLADNSPHPVYSYRFSKKRENSFLEDLLRKSFPDLKLKGAAHGADAEFIFKFNVPNVVTFKEHTDDEKKYVQALTTIITTFGKTGNPNSDSFPGWKPTLTSDPQYLELGDDIKMIPGHLYAERIQFWNNVYDKYARIF
uniref:Carboxylic ester hydrolase n=1 Tax=Clastoptera arizonana TaxID=38151 RepID=A0A1B6D898_9HEMI